MERVPEPDDRRSVRARLAQARRVRSEAIWNQFELAEGLSQEDLAKLRHICLQLVENAGKELGR